MLGRQQIAGIQNAVSELYKNAHDAYATLARADYFEGQKLLVVRDNGVGMTRKDFEDKWLVLGTESKFGDGVGKQYRPEGMEVRPITGEKGIGRLAIALLGRMVLVLSRARREDGLKDLVMGLVHWGIFELPGLNLDEIEIPVKTIPGGRLPSEEECATLATALRDCVERLDKNHSELDFSKIQQDIKAFRPDPADLAAVLEPHDDGKLSLSGDGTGTHFIIAPAASILDLDISAEDRLQDYGFRKSLLGFYNQVFLARPPATISTSFRVWKPGSAVGEERLDPQLFFTADEVPNVDHYLSGNVDDFGQFSGILRVYEKTYEGLDIAWKESLGRRTECGPFRVEFGYIMGNKSESSLAPDQFDEISSKVERLGGMYIYRDGVRILPYGDHSFDWLEIEKRRNKGAGYYFFSYRRMFGAVILSRENNGSLVEKAGREGWQQNSAYRQLREILMNLLTQLAAEFFRKGGTHTELFEQHQSELRRQSALLEKREKQVTAKKKKFLEALDSFFNEVNSGLVVQKLTSLRQQTTAAMQLAATIPDQDQAAAALIRAEKSGLEQMRKIREGCSIRRPIGVGLSKGLHEKWDAYQTERKRLEHEVFVPFEQDVAETLGEVAKQARVYVNQRRRLEERLKAIQEERQKVLKQAVARTRETATNTRDTVFEVTQRAVQDFDSAYRRIETDLGRINLDQLDEASIEKQRQQWEEQLLEIERRHRGSLEAARDMLALLAENLKASDGGASAEIMEAMDDRMIALEEQADEDFEMVQLGLAVAIINHEFGAAIRNVRNNIQELGFISRGSKAIRPLYDSIRSNFEHLDGHLGLFTPLQRRLHRKAVRITGKAIHRYVHDLFSNRLERHAVEVACTESFMAATVECYPSTIYPVFINLVDNAIHWLKTISGPRKIVFDAEEGAFIVANNGPNIPDRDVAGLFERGFTRKPGGRGLGLFIAKKALKKEEMDIVLDIPPPGFNVAFRITASTLRLVP
jgi:signal transduction histidine kinase